MSDVRFITKQSEIPEANYYVVMDDSFMSGWGPAESKTNTLIFLCASMSEAETVYNNAKARTDMKRVRINTEKPRLVRGHAYQIKTARTYPNWYRTGAFGGLGSAFGRR